MKISGYESCDLPIEQIKFIDLAEIALEATPQELRKIARFLSLAAENMEKMGSDFGHEHLGDKQAGFQDSPHFVVFRANNDS